MNPALTSALRTLVFPVLLLAAALGAGCATAPKPGEAPRFMTSEREPVTRDRLGRSAMASDLIVVRSNLGARHGHRRFEQQDELVRAAAAAADVKSIKILLAVGASPNTASADGRKPVAAAAAGGHVEAISSAPTPRARRPVAAAAAGGHVEATRVLLDNGGSADQSGADG